MGTGRDKRKKAKDKKGELTSGVGAVKTERKTSRNELKAERRAERALEGDEDNIDALLAQFALQDKAKKEVVIEADCPPPSPRVNGSLVPYITPKSSELILFGGEYTDLTTGKVHVNADLYRFDVDKVKWMRVQAPSSPSPRCAHQAVVYKGCMYVFGGEFSSPNQERFMHFRDLWRLDLSTHEWDSLPTRGGPSARSGHRMALHKNKAILFGGFYDTGSEVKYYNDLWELDLSELTRRRRGGGGPENCGAAGGGQGQELAHIQGRCADSEPLQGLRSAQGLSAVQGRGRRERAALLSCGLRPGHVDTQHAQAARAHQPAGRGGGQRDVAARRHR